MPEKLETSQIPKLEKISGRLNHYNPKNPAFEKNRKFQMGKNEAQRIIFQKENHN